ncbi:UDP-N-acetylglucosamine--undecaprenyl-phosphate N-acetylglucosaminephosphotransferase [Fulvivirga kasyanovii]|uniref:Undecaprenyl/decaprenyl-phosphate alpha-N-acetylglucosaminyl 1-phosphate transferase n=1 Tax=Fulvivirga kasyanovii TaxID=396812 RepID=A0ABW9RXY3_9BACT|nr:MraY family glycosyltransferase [Fulvivirga kasyanovii]MTI29102.1 undecaprenyl/decaprenyl-phosphate alpha-N-acetylglucosaminyl 1-phosphate transferase [Fulvivirga kasyanovii]
MDTFHHIPTILIATVITWIVIPWLRKLALLVGLVDTPNERKIHRSPVPLVGGMAIFTGSFFSFLLTNPSWANMGDIKVIVLGAILLLLVGVIDDKLNIRASLKLLIQIALAYYAFRNGLKIDSLYGIFGIYKLPEAVQYVLTLLVITGVVNAFNLMDGIDGLAAGLAVVGLGAFTVLAILAGEAFLITLYLSLIGSLIAFLRFNFDKKNKIFMGDAGSLFLGFILVVSAISILQTTKDTSHATASLATIIGVLALPVVDSLRVYKRRIANGHSPFKADRTHLHHLVLFLGLKHRASSLLIILISALFIAVSTIFGSLIGITFTALAILALFTLVTTILRINQNVSIWKDKIREMESS